MWLTPSFHRSENNSYPTENTANIIAGIGMKLTMMIFFGSNNAKRIVVVITLPLAPSEPNFRIRSCLLGVLALRDEM